MHLIITIVHKTLHTIFAVTKKDPEICEKIRRSHTFGRSNMTNLDDKTPRQGLRIVNNRIPPPSGYIFLIAVVHFKTVVSRFN